MKTATNDQVESTNEAVNLKDVLTNLTKANPLQLSKLDLSTVPADKIGEVAQALQDRITDAVNGGVLVDKRSGLVYTGGTFIGNVGRPIKAMNVIPAAFKVKEDHITNGKVDLASASVEKGTDALRTNVIAACRFIMAGQTGNGVNLVGQTEKTIKGAAIAMGTIKGGLA